jgi:hypothetical protein
MTDHKIGTLLSWRANLSLGSERHETKRGELPG